jgi:hypothetical protein
LAVELDERTKALKRALNLIFDKDVPINDKRRRLTFPQVIDIRFDILDGTLTQEAIARKHGISQGMVSLIANHRRHRVHRD